MNLDATIGAVIGLGLSDSSRAAIATSDSYVSRRIATQTLCHPSLAMPGFYPGQRFFQVCLTDSRYLLEYLKAMRHRREKG